MAAEPSESAGEKFQRLVEIMARLRAPDGCPWDREQTFDSLKAYLLEESYEVLEAIDLRDWEGLSEELGDLLLQPVFLAQMASDEGRFRIENSLDAINEKLVRRHPHIFQQAIAHTSADVKRRWDEIKAEEKRKKGHVEKGMLDSIPRSVPALVEAQKISSRAATAGFDWETVEQVIDKLHEELGELKEARSTAVQADIEGELGDLLFVIVNMARFLRVDPEQALRRTNAKFRYRFGHVEESLRQAGKTPGDATSGKWRSCGRKPNKKLDRRSRT